MVDDIHGVLDRFLDIQRTDILVGDDTHRGFQVLCQLSAVLIALDKQKCVGQDDADTGQAQ